MDDFQDDFKHCPRHPRAAISRAGLTIQRSKEGLSGVGDSCLLSTAKGEDPLIGGHLHSELNHARLVTA